MAYPTVAEIRARVKKLASTDDFPTAWLQDLIDEFQEKAERYRGVSFVSTTATAEKHTLSGQRVVRLEWPVITSITSATVTDSAGTVTTLTVADIVIDHGAPLVDLGATYTGVLSITYVHGLATTPPSIVRACREYVRASALRDFSGVGRDVETQGFEGGGTTRYVVENWAEGRPTAYLEVNSLLNGVRDYRLVNL